MYSLPVRHLSSCKFIFPSHRFHETWQEEVSGIYKSANTTSAFERVDRTHYTNMYTKGDKETNSCDCGHRGHDMVKFFSKKIIPILSTRQKFWFS
jgi:hypothetical protein